MTSDLTMIGARPFDILRHPLVIAIFASAVLCTQPASSGRAKADGRDPAVLAAPGPQWTDPFAFPLASGRTSTVHRSVPGQSGFNHHPYLSHYDGKFWAIWSSSRMQEEGVDQRVMYATSVDGHQWTPMQVLTPDPDGPDGPIRWIARGLWLDDGRLTALAAQIESANYAQRGKDVVWKNLRLMRYQWEAGAWIPKGVFADDCMNNFPPALLGGVLSMACRDRYMNVSMARLEDAATVTWRRVPLHAAPPFHKMDEPTWYRDPQGIVHMVVRDNNRSRRLVRALSHDEGRTWGAPVMTNYPDATAKNFTGRLSNGWYFLISNPNPDGRNPLSISFSRDGWVFERPMNVRVHPRSSRVGERSQPKGSPQYPHAVEHGGSLWVIYSVNQEDIELTEIPLGGLVAQTTALWLFDEQVDTYPSTVLSDAASNDYPLILGNGGRIVAGKFGNALEPTARPPMAFPSGSVNFGLRPPKKPAGRTADSMTWQTANFAALMTMGERHLRIGPAFANATDTKLNLGAFDWTVEFWLRALEGSGARGASATGVVFEVGQGPLGEQRPVTRLTLAGDAFVLVNQPSGAEVRIPTQPPTPRGGWHHYAFVYASAERQVRHYVDGQPQQPPVPCTLQRLPHGDEAYVSLGRDGRWQQPLQGVLDEVRFSEGQVYRAAFKSPGSFAEPLPKLSLKAGPPLLFAADASGTQPPTGGAIPLGNRKHLFIDDALVASRQDVSFSVHPPRLTGRVIDPPPGHFTKHVTVLEDDDGLLRMYYEGPGDTLAVMTSRDGVHWEMPDLGQGEYNGARNIAIRDKVRNTGTVFVDPNAPREQRWKFVGGFTGRSIYGYSSPDGWRFRRHPTSLLPLAAGSQSFFFYDEQRQAYIAYMRSMIASTPGGATQREFVWTSVKDLLKPWPFTPITAERTAEIARSKRLRSPQPWYLDNGPLAPAGLGLEFPVVFGPDPALDPPATDVYVLKVVKYPWALDAYLAFPGIYFHYQDDGPKTRQALGTKARGLGSGVVETQLAVSRDGVKWTRYPRPVYVGLGKHDGLEARMIYMAQGLVRRGDEIWQYYLVDAEYHSTWTPGPPRRGIYRTVQRLDGFVSIDAPYTGGTFTTKPFTFSGNRLVLNIDTAAAGYGQVGILDGDGRPIAGYGVDDCLYINGDSVRMPVEWQGQGVDLSALQGKSIRLMFRMRGASLYALQFLPRE